MAQTRFYAYTQSAKTIRAMFRLQRMRVSSISDYSYHTKLSLIVIRLQQENETLKVVIEKVSLEVLKDKLSNQDKRVQFKEAKWSFDSKCMKVLFQLRSSLEMTAL